MVSRMAMPEGEESELQISAVFRVEKMHSIIREWNKSEQKRNAIKRKVFTDYRRVRNCQMTKAFNFRTEIKFPQKSQQVFTCKLFSYFHLAGSMPHIRLYSERAKKMKFAR